jgi:hypothetical protein
LPLGIVCDYQIIKQYARYSWQIQQVSWWSANRRQQQWCKSFGSFSSIQFFLAIDTLLLVGFFSFFFPLQGLFRNSLSLSLSLCHTHTHKQNFHTTCILKFGIWGRISSAAYFCVCVCVFFIHCHASSFAVLGTWSC